VIIGSIAAGAGRDFIPMPFEGHADAQFCVQTVCFRYSDFAHTGGNQTSSHCGPIKEGTARACDLCGFSARQHYSQTGDRRVILVRRLISNNRWSGP